MEDADAAQEYSVTLKLRAAFALVRERRGTLEGNITPTIMRAPLHIRGGKRHFYEPTCVSIGPFHHGREHLQVMEEHKWECLHDLVSKAIDPDAMLDILARQMKALEAKARRCYAGSIDLHSDEFVKMMVLDGCFFLSFLIDLFPSYVPVGRRIGWDMIGIMSDILKLENQLPYFALERLYETFQREMRDPTWPGTSREGRVVSLLDLAGNFLTVLQAKNRENIYQVNVIHHHMLHLLQISVLSTRKLREQEDPEPYNGVITNMLAKTKNLFSFLLSHLPSGHTLAPPSPPPLEGSYGGPAPRPIPTVTGLQEAGITIKKNTTGYFDFSFSDGTLEISDIYLTPDLKSMYANIVLFEQCCKTTYPSTILDAAALSTYARFMNAIIDTPKDVAILKQLGIIMNDGRASDEEEAIYFHQLTDYGPWLTLTKLYAVYIEINKYCDSDWHKWRAGLKRDYFSNPWSVMSLAAAIILLILTFLQTFFAIYSYFRPH